ncbi:MAG: hypothetical protein QOJ01_994, partial [Solirubrobacterales bacterium]|nr:hypothetical protein [Solirubrobacterales bacterium]
MRRIAGFVVVIAIAAGIVLLARSTGSSGDYMVRAYFDNGDFVVKGEQVRIAGASVGSVASTDVSMPGEEVNQDGTAQPGKAIIVLDITKPG